MRYFQGRALWMASVAVRSGHPVPVSRWTATDRMRAVAVAKGALYGVGDPATDVVEYGGYIVTVRRVATWEERASVPEPHLDPCILRPQGQPEGSVG